MLNDLSGEPNVLKCEGVEKLVEENGYYDPSFAITDKKI